MEQVKRKVRYEEMLPHELDEAVARFPVAYCAFGSLEWHGRHLPLGNDTLKAYHILLLAAEKFGGVVVPPTYWGILGKWHPWTMIDFGERLVEDLYVKIFQGLVDVGFKVVIGVTGHDVEPQKAAIQKAVEAIKGTGKATGFAMMEGDLYDLTDDRMDHAAHWETSLMMYLRPELVDLGQIMEEDLESDEGRREAGIFGKDPRKHASRELGEKIAKRIADGIGQKAEELLRSLGR
ncbi:MAG: creatininase family protein [Candidatus Brockarchaeota archaeon]|nr:creatininase family protein [Candidatus Brockarchaeota archaeon]